MISKELRQELDSLAAKYGGSVIYDCALAGRSHVGIGGTVDAWYEPSCPEELRDARKLFCDRDIKTLVVGNASNVLFPDGNLSAVVINLSAAPFLDVRMDGGTVTAGSGAPLGGLVSECCRRGLAGMEGLVGIPGTAGGAVRMNAGYMSDISDRIEKVLVMDRTGAMLWKAKEELVFGYRWSSLEEDDIVIQAVFKLEQSSPEELLGRVRDAFREKMEKQPLDKKTLGSVFKNHPGTMYKSAQMIDMAGFKGKRRGGALVSEKHANFIANEGGATAADYRGLIEEIRAGVKAKFGVEMETEIKIL